MTPKEKANELVQKYKSTKHQILMTFMAKDYALIAQQNTIDVLEEITDDNSSWEGYKHDVVKRIEFEKEVKKEIENL